MEGLNENVYLEHGRCSERLALNCICGASGEMGLKTCLCSKSCILAQDFLCTKKIRSVFRETSSLQLYVNVFRTISNVFRKIDLVEIVL